VLIRYHRWQELERNKTKLSPLRFIATTSAATTSTTDEQQWAGEMIMVVGGVVRQNLPDPNDSHGQSKSYN
jgi:hypothetical protein